MSTTDPVRGRRAVSEAGRLAAMLLSPTFIVLGLVVGYPLVAALRESLYRSGQDLDASGFVVQGDQFVGLANYTDIFNGPAAARFWNAFGNTTFFTVVTVSIEVVIGVGMAVVMHQALRWRGIVRASILVPWAIPTAVSALLWRWIFQADGVANAIIGSQVLWTTEGWQAKLAVIIADTWKTAPFIGLLVLAGLAVIPRDVYEAARVDGASPARQFWSITLPLVKPVLAVAILFRVLDSLRMFDLPFVLVGNRKESVETLSMLAWDEASNLRFGPAASYAVILFLYVGIAAWVFVKLLDADVISEARDRTRQVQEPRRKTALKPEAVPA